jgi:hypothetical protein
MKQLEQALMELRGVARRLRAVAPGAAASHRPVRLCLRLGGERGMALGAWEDALVRVHQWLGPIRVVFGGDEPVESPHLEKLVQFANRLECPTVVVTRGPIGWAFAEVLVDRGLAAANVVVEGPDAADAIGSVQALVEVRDQRRRPLAVHVAFPATAESAAAAPQVGALARQHGADGVFAFTPAGRDPVAADLGPGAIGVDVARRPRGLRAEIRADGSMWVCDATEPLGRLKERDPRGLWESGDALVARVRAMERPWDETELVPFRVRSRR